MKPLLYLHGFSGGTWEGQVLQERFGYPVQAVEMPGHQGVIPGEHFHFDEAVERVVRVASECRNPVNLVGYSMGARVGLAAVLRAPTCFERAVFIGVRPGIESVAEREARKRLDEVRAQKLDDLGIVDFMDWWETLPVIASQIGIEPEIREAMKRVRRQHSGAGLSASLREMGAGAMPSLWSALEALEVSCLLVTGERDERFAAIAEEMLKRSDRLVHAQLVDAGHCAHWEQPEAFGELLSQFLGRDD